MNLTISRRANRRAGVLWCLLAGSPAAQAKPDFSGDWKLNTSKSEFGPIPPPTAAPTRLSIPIRTLRLGPRNHAER